MWGDPNTERLLVETCSRWKQGDEAALSQLRVILTRECGAPFAAAVITRLQEGVAAGVFGFLGDPIPAATMSAPPEPATPVPPVDRPSSPLPTTGYVSVRAVAAHFGVSTKAVYRWMASGRIQSERRPGGSYRIPAQQFHPDA